MTRSEIVRLWHVRLDGPASVEWLSEDERARAARFHFEADRTRFVNCRSRLRHALSEFTQCPPGQVQFSYGPFGKPYLAGSDVRFNVSHATDDALIAIAMGREIGVDLERIDPRIKPEELARQFFTPAEAALVMASPPEDRHEAFLACWTRKEAWAKALGLGIGENLSRFDVAGAIGLPICALRDPFDGGDWTLLELNVAPGLHAALAVEGTGVSVQKYS